MTDKSEVLRDQKCNSEKNYKNTVITRCPLIKQKTDFLLNVLSFKINNDTSDTSNASDNASDQLIFCDMVDQKTDQSNYNDPDDQITDRTGRKILQ